ncbi:FtsX-like permease family protein [Virgibacillus proomii]|uniref:FtsX-like permease family protein n=1 Tax=Virgibacillus proomii TaxID=84407 RepID=UPI001C0FDC81|nr:ABC transporter permease [Virgibacillus proomii]MBU5266129.1 ABC transporter permease [Virgibacillus proomii]
MFKLSIRLLLSRKNWLFLLVVTIAVSVATILSIYSGTEAIKTKLVENAYKQYGSHSGVLFGVHETKKSVAKKVDGVGQFQLLNTVKANNGKTITVGWMDQDAIMYGKIKLLNGTFPTKKNEVAIEQSYLKALDMDWKIGEKKVLQINHRSEKVTLSGIIQDYSANWTVPINMKRGINDFPNIFVSKEYVNRETNNYNFLFAFNGSKKRAISSTTNLLDNYNANNGIINSRLFDLGLKDYDTISNLSFIYIVIMLITTLLAISVLFFYFNLDQQKKLGLFKNFGASPNTINLICFYQCLIIFSLGILVAVPISIPAHYYIIKTTYAEGQLSFTNILLLVILVIMYLLIVFITIVIYSLMSIKRVQTHSIHDVIEQRNQTEVIQVTWIKKVNTFKYKQLLRQLFTNPIKSLFIMLSLSSSILVVSFSILLQKETAGIWDTKDFHYLVSQETYGYENIDNFKVLNSKPVYFFKKDVDTIEHMEGIERVEKIPFMADVHALINDDLANSEQLNTYDHQVILPDVKYILLDKEAFEKIYGKGMYESFARKAILHIPDSANLSLEKWQGETIRLIRKYKEASTLKTKQWDYEVWNVIKEPFADYDTITIVLDEEKAIADQLFPGYEELSIYEDDDITAAQKKEIRNFIHHMVSTTPGSLYQDNNFMVEDTKISNLIGIIGQVAFLASVILAVISIVVIVFSKYHAQRKIWGTYLSIGMNKKQVLRFLRLEMYSYLTIASVISLGVFLIILLMIDHIYPTYIYILYFILSVAIIGVFILIGGLTIKNKVNQHSAYSLLRSDY